MANCSTSGRCGNFYFSIGTGFGTEETNADWTTTSRPGTDDDSRKETAASIAGSDDSSTYAVDIEEIENSSTSQEQKNRQDRPTSDIVFIEDLSTCTEVADADPPSSTVRQRNDETASKLDKGSSSSTNADEAASRRTHVTARKTHGMKPSSALFCSSLPISPIRVVNKSSSTCSERQENDETLLEKEPMKRAPITNADKTATRRKPKATQRTIKSTGLKKRDKKSKRILQS